MTDLKKQKDELKDKKQSQSDSFVSRMSAFSEKLVKKDLNPEEVIVIEQWRENRKMLENTINVGVNVGGEVKGVTQSYNEQGLAMVPKEVDAFMVEFHDEQGKNIREAFEIISIMANENPKAADWIFENPDTFANAWLHGRAILPDKRFITRAPNPKHPAEPLYLVIDENGGTALIPARNVISSHRLTLTEEEIDQDFSWLRMCHLSVEVEEDVYGLPSEDWQEAN